MSEARVLLPTDLLALVSSTGHSFRNEAWPRERLGADESARPLAMMLDQFVAFAKGRSAWVSMRRGRLQGLASARQRGGRQAWEIDYLIDATGGHEVTTALLEAAIAEAGRSGAEKLFLRLSADSELLTAVREAGFMPYQEEVLYARRYSRDPEGEAVNLRPVDPSDSYLLYRLYNLATPESTRRSEAATFSEWHACQERRWLKNGVELMDEQGGQVRAWVKAARLPHGVVVEALLSEASLNDARNVVAAAARAVDAGGAPLFVLAPSQGAICGRLETSGFVPHQRFISLMRRTTRPVQLPKLSPAVVENAVGV